MISRKQRYGNKASWRLMLVGQFLTTLSVLIASGPGTIDIVDGRTRYEEAKSLAVHQDLEIRGGGDAWFGVFPGREGKMHSSYRFPHVALGAVSVRVADIVARDHDSESYRQFWFSLLGAFAGALMAILFSIWFFHQGASRIEALFWGFAGVFCTPIWYYSTSTFDDVFGTIFIVSGIVIAMTGNGRQQLIRFTVAALLFALAINSKPPLLLFYPIYVAIAVRMSGSRKEALRLAVILHVCIILAGLALVGYDLYKFPIETRAERAILEGAYGFVWASSPFPGMISLLFSSSASIFLFAPSVLLSINGLVVEGKERRWLVLTTVVGCVAFFVAISWLAFFKGDICWGPRYLTPIVGVLWLFARKGAMGLSKSLVSTIILAGVVVQLLGLAANPIKMWIEKGIPNGFYESDPWGYFDPRVSNLFSRPAEVVSLIRGDSVQIEVGDVQPEISRILPHGSPITIGNTEILYSDINALRPWWTAHRLVPLQKRPIDIRATLWLLFWMAASGICLVYCGWVMAKKHVTVGGG